MPASFPDKDPRLALLVDYPEPLLDQVRQQLASGHLGAYLAWRYPEAHGIHNESALYEHASALKGKEEDPSMADVLDFERIERRRAVKAH